MYVGYNILCIYVLYKYNLTSVVIAAYSLLNKVGVSAVVSLIFGKKLSYRIKNMCLWRMLWVKQK
jgi:hypothetical protein